MSVKIKIGDIFSVEVELNRWCFFQFIGRDITQLNSEVIRIFKTIYEDININHWQDIVNDDVSFHAHCILKLGIRLGYWNKVGHASVVGDSLDILFRSSEDDGKGSSSVSSNWWIWRINQEQKKVGSLTGINRLAEIGSVIPPDSIVYRIKNGQYDFIYPSF